ncbi:MAG: helix-turn-helix domain-containing protein, partial [Acidobacteria bacterium]|nr:helix-turn-helix domain-containing protein [Acidobacteriota bacterium]
MGRKLRTAREQQGLSLAEIATRTRIRLSYLEAIEQDRLDQIPGGFFSRSFVRQYAQALGLSSADIDSDLEAVTIPPVETVPVEKVLRDYRPTKPTLLVEDDGSQFFHEAE